MDIRLAVVVLGVLLSAVHGRQPRPAEEPGISSSEDAKKIVPLEVSTTKDVKKTTVGEKEESPGKLKVPLTSLGAKLKARFLEDSKLPSTSKEVQEDAVRTARQLSSPNIHQMSFGKGPHTTTVCIQVRSDHQSPQVICGPQYGEREGPAAAPGAARYASPYEYARAAQEYPQQPPAPARRFPMKAAEAEPQPRPENPNFQPASGHGPLNPQVSPQGTPAVPLSPVYVHRRYYEPLYSDRLLSPSQSLMRLNCAVDPLGQLVSPQLVRGGPLGYQTLGEGPPAKFGTEVMSPQHARGGPHGYQDHPIGDAVFTLPDGSPAKFGANIVSPAPMRTQSAFASPQWSRSAADDMAYLSSQMMESPQSYSSGAWNSGAYPMESYPMEMMQGRSAASADGNPTYMGYPAADEPTRREYIQLQALRESQEKLREIQEQLISLREREELQKLSSKNSSISETSKDASAAATSITSQPKSTKATKRHTRPM